jgi:hypothetical protein
MENEESNHKEDEIDPCEICKVKGRPRFIKYEMPEEDWTYDSTEV